jgi:hypothetical protein
MPVDIEVIGADRLAAGLTRAAGTAAPEELRGAMETSLLLIEGDARRTVKRDTGRLQNSITHRVSGNAAAAGTLVGAVGPSEAYGVYVERGRRPGRPPPLSAVAGWARRHGVSPYVVARAIGRKGVKAAPFLVPAYEKNRGRIDALFARAGARVVEAVTRG